MQELIPGPLVVTEIFHSALNCLPLREMTSPPSPASSNNSESFAEFERLESTLPDPLRSLASSLLALSQTPLQTNLQPTSLTTVSRRLHNLNPSSVRESLPIPIPKPLYNPQIPKPALNTSQSSTGVLWVTERASEYGYNSENNSGPSAWANLGQGAPEHGDTIPGSFPRPTSIPITDHSKEYGPTAGVRPLREAVANYYNHTYRSNKSSKYTYKNVCIVPGGRAGLTRIASIIHDCYLAFFLPDYTAYAEMLSLFKNFSPIPVPLHELDNYEVHLRMVREELDRGIQALLTSNPRNPTGRCMSRSQLRNLHALCRTKCLLIMDEFYSHYYYDDNCSGSSISLAEYVDDVDRDPVLILNGLTKLFRLPGWRTCWILGPQEYISALSSAGSFLDGGLNAPCQFAAVSLLEPNRVLVEMRALQVHFKRKRDYILERLTRMGFSFSLATTPNSTFYLWLNLSQLPGKLSNCLGFFHECLHERVIVVPGFFFLINPHHLSRLHDAIWYHYVRISYGPEMEHLVAGMDGIERILAKFDCLPYKIDEKKD